MNEYEVFHRLATYPFTSATIGILQCALQVIRQRYPLAFSQDSGEAISQFPPQEAFKQTNMPLHVTAEWIDYMQTVARSVNTTEQEVSLSLSHLARGGHVDNDIVTDYVRLLQAARPSSQCIDPILFTSDNIEAAARLRSSSGVTTIIPCNYDGAWFAAVAHADCVQLYGVQDESSSKLEQQLQALFLDRIVRFSKPLVATQVEDTGVLMLLSMRMLASGGVPTQGADTTFLQNSRARIFIELLTQTLDAKDSDVSSRLQKAQAENSFFFDEAFCEDDTFSPVGSTFTANMGDGVDFAFSTSPEPIRSPLSAGEVSPSTGTGLGVATGVSAQALRHPSSSPHPAGPAYEKLTSLRSGWVFDIGMYGLPPSMPRECRIILDMLSEAVAFYRSSRLSESSKLAVIWSAIKSGSKSEFYRRYSGVLFHKEMLHLSSNQEVALRLKTSTTMTELREMRRHQSDFQIWHDICQLRRDWGPGQYALLCVLPERPQLERMNKREQQTQLQQICERLGDDRDALSRYLCTAEKLCTALIQGNLPSGRLMIDDYHFKANQDLSEPEFAAYTSLDPRPVIPISRCGAH
ncbi:hypothetical protein LZ30DRAFT_693440 [Colletotrichum cereale]|nr:hypothetical protein LZ30DRAFT_693440 [Colletotrichum cereale]